MPSLLPVWILTAAGLFFWFRDAGIVYVWLCFSQTEGSWWTPALPTGWEGRQVIKQSLGYCTGRSMPHKDSGGPDKSDSSWALPLSHVISERLRLTLRLGFPASMQSGRSALGPAAPHSHDG